MIATILLAALGAGRVDLQLKSSELAFGDPLSVEVHLVNSGKVTARVLQAPVWTLLDAEAGLELAGAGGTAIGVGPSHAAIEIAAGQTLTLRSDLWASLGLINWLNAQGKVVTRGVLLPGKYWIQARVLTDAEPKRALLAEAEIVIRPGLRARELKTIQSMLTPVPRGFAPEYAAWTGLVSELRQCCSGTPVLEPIWRAACGAAGEMDAVRCIDEFLGAFPNSAWGGELRSLAAQSRKQHDQRNFEEQLGRLPRAEFNRYVQIHSMEADVPAAIDKRLELTRAFVQDHPESLAAPALLCEAIHVLRGVDRFREADEISRQVLVRYANSFPARAWNGLLPLRPSDRR